MSANCGRYSATGVGQKQLAALDQYHRRDRDDRFGHRGQREDRIGAHRVAGILVAKADRFEPGELAVPGDAEDCAGDPARFNLATQHIHRLPQLPARQPDRLGSCGRKTRCI